MDSPIELKEETKDKLNQLIDIKLKEGYLLVGGMEKSEEGGLIQVMAVPANIDSEMTLAGALRGVIMLIIWLTVAYYFVF